MITTITRTCEYCGDAGVEFDAEDPMVFEFTPICEDCAEGMLWAEDRD